MTNFFAIVFFRSRILLRDDLSAITVVAYFLSLNVFTILGGCKLLFQHSCLSEVPLFYSLLIMLMAGVITRFALLRSVMAGNVFSNPDEQKIAVTKKGIWLTGAYFMASFGLMLSVV